ncbi:alpha-defensin 26-like [Microtus oregoni]|uniref:alpha-defensin 26-like n=1 Tax=Microtus oregoni TaxID=111838 RepID=UPI001BB1FB8A|nr:alpha-defensin 26-like [Microtus oregoni]
MKTLVLITTLLLVLQAQAEPLLGAAEEAPDKMQPSEEDQALSISFGGLESSGLQDAGLLRNQRCSCRPRCSRFERVKGTCLRPPKSLLLCCP